MMILLFLNLFISLCEGAAGLRGIQFCRVSQECFLSKDPIPALGEHGKDTFFKELATQVPKEAAVILEKIAQYQKSNLDNENVLCVQCDFFKGQASEKSACGSLYMGTFISGNFPFAFDGNTNKKLGEAEKTMGQFKNPRHILDWFAERKVQPALESHPVQGGQKEIRETAYYRIPKFFWTSAYAFPPVSSGDLCVEDGSSFQNRDAVISRFAAPFLSNDVFCPKLFGHAAFDINGADGCFESSFSDCFAHSEQAWLNFLRSPRPKHIGFSSHFDIRSAESFDVTLFSYRDICRYCRGSVSWFYSTGWLQDRLVNFFQDMPALMKTHWNKYGTRQKIHFPQVAKMQFKIDNLYAYSMHRIDDKVRSSIQRKG